MNEDFTKACWLHHVAPADHAGGAWRHVIVWHYSSEGIRDEFA